MTLKTTILLLTATALFAGVSLILAPAASCAAVPVSDLATAQPSILAGGGYGLGCPGCPGCPDNPVRNPNEPACY